MKLLRNIAVVLVALSLALLVGVFLISPLTVANIAQGLEESTLLVRLPLAIIIVAIIIALAYLMLRGERGRKDEGLHVKAGGALADVSIDSARTRILKAVRAVPSVVSADAQVHAQRGKADVELDVVISGDGTNIPEKHKEIDRALKQAINKQLGLQMAGKPRVHLRFENEELPAAINSVKSETFVAPPKVETPPTVLITDPPKADPDELAQLDEPIVKPMSGMSPSNLFVSPDEFPQNGDTNQDKTD